MKYLFQTEPLSTDPQVMDSVTSSPTIAFEGAGSAASSSSEADKAWFSSSVNLADVLDEHPLSAAAAQVRDALSNPAFPCTFVRSALNKGLLRMVRINPSDTDHVHHAHRLIGHYLHAVRSCTSRTEAAMMVMLLDVEIDEYETAESIRNAAWSLLEKLNEYDGRAGNLWPSDISTDMDDPNWAYSLHGTALFMNMTSSKLLLRRSRNLGRPLVMVIQPTDGLHEIAPNNHSGDRIRARIRTRIDEWDGLPHSPELSNAGDSGNSDWRQFWLGDSNARSPWIPPTIPLTHQARPDTLSDEDSPGRCPRHMAH